MTETPYATTFKYLMDMKNHVGQELGLTTWSEITQDKINTFAELTGDTQWIHVDEEKSKKHSPYGQTVAHGFMVLSFSSQFPHEAYSMDDVTMGVNYGLDKVRFPNATLSGSMMRGRVSLLEFMEFEGGARYKLKVVFECKGVAKPVCVAEFVVQAYTGK
jgi:acyl dehydratase